MMTGPAYQNGDNVFVFYRMDQLCERHRKYLAVLDPRHGGYRPRMGLANGWVPARVTRDQDPKVRAGEVCIEYRWQHFYTKQGQCANSSIGWTEWYPLNFVCKAPAMEPLSLLLPGCQPDLAIVAFRWGGRQHISHCAQWGDTGASISDTFFTSFLEKAVAPALGTSYEVWIVYIEDHSDMYKIADTAHLVFGPNHPARRAKHSCAMFFLWPTAFEESCVPTEETGSDGGAGLVDQKSFFRMMKSVERAGLPTRFPHCSGLYEQLASKSWTYTLSLTPHLRVPPTIAVPRSLLELGDGCEVAASSAMKSLREAKRQQAVLRGEADCNGSVEIAKGVAKLGFSWEALDVKFWKGQRGLQQALHDLTQTIEISEELTAQPHDLESLIVQEYIAHDLELRIYTVEGKVEGSIYTKFCSIKDNNEFGEFEQLFDKGQAAKQWMGDDSAALDDGERQCLELTQHWLAWLRTQTCEVPPAIRFDYFVGRTGEAKGKATVWTLEICELGFSMLAHSELPEKVFEAMLRGCLGHSAATDVQETSAKRMRTEPG